MAMSAKEHQDLVDELRGANETRITEIALALSENYTAVVREDSANRVTVQDLNERMQRLQEQNDKFFLAATARNRESGQEAATGIPAGTAGDGGNDDDELPSDLLDGMFDARGNMILPEKK